MVRHIVMWNFKEELNGEEVKELKSKIKEGLEALKDIVPGTVSVHVVTDALDSANRDIMLDSLFTTEDDLNNYQKHPEHLQVAEIIKSATCNRTCMDYVE